MVNRRWKGHRTMRDEAAVEDHDDFGMGVRQGLA